MQRRINELDFLKAIFIILMIAFHLVYISESYPYVKLVVHTFHMPGFLIISGYLMNVSKSIKAFAGTLLGYAIPYAIIESSYIVMASVLPIREHIDNLNVSVFIDRLLIHPVGPYWYLQTLVICGGVYALVFRLLPMKTISKVILLGIIYFLISDGLGNMQFACSLYFLAGVVVRQSGVPFTNIFQSSSVAIIAFALLAIYPQNLLMEVSGGVLMVFLIISGILFFYKHLNQKACSLFLFIGRNTMPLFLFSPIFTFLCKPLVPVLLFDSTGLLFLFVSLLICISGSLAVEWVMDKIGLSSYFYANKKLDNVKPFKHQKLV